MQVEVEGEINILIQIYFVGFLHLQLIHVLALSPQVTVYSARVHTGPGVESGFSRLWYGVGVVQTTLSALFRSTNTGVVVRGFRSSFVPVTHEGYLVKSRRPL